MLEFTGDYYKCSDCLHVWDYMETHCPECGEQDFEEIDAHEVVMTAETAVDNEQKRLLEMLKLHGDY